MNKNTRLRNSLLVASIFLVVTTSCDGIDELGGDEGLVGIPFQNGVECLGDEANLVAGDVVYVSPDGDDGNSGDSQDAPLRTLARALCNVHPGQTVRVMPGAYRESVILGAFGDADAPIVIQGVADGERLPVLDGESIRTMGIALVESVNVVVENLEFRNYTDEGLYVLLGSDIVVRNNRFIANGRASIDPDADGEGFGVNVDGAARVTIKDNEAAENGPAPERVTQYILGTGINTFELQDSVIRANYSHDNIGGGILVEDGVGVLVENNRIENNELDANGDYWDGAIWVDGGHGITLRGNTISGNHGPGIEISDEDVQYPDASFGYVLEGNQVTDNLYGVYVWNFGRCPLPSEKVVAFSGNVIEDNTERDFWCEEWACGEGEACE